MDKAREMKKQWKLRVLKRVQETKAGIEMDKQMLQDIVWNLNTIDEQMIQRKLQLESDKVTKEFEVKKITQELLNFETDKRITKLQMQSTKAKFEEQLRVKEHNIKVYEKQLKEGVKSEIKRTE